MKKILSLLLVAVLPLTLAVPVSADGFHGGGFRGGFRGGFHHDGFRRFSCCFGPAFVSGVFVGSALAYPYHAYPYAAYPVYQDPAYVTAPVYQPQVSQICYAGGCYYLHGDGVTAAYSWVWVPAAPAAPAAPPGPTAPPGR